MSVINTPSPAISVFTSPDVFRILLPTPAVLFKLAPSAPNEDIVISEGDSLIKTLVPAFSDLNLSVEATLFIYILPVPVPTF